MNTLIAIAANAGITGFALWAFAKWILDKAVKQVMDKDLENHKGEIQNKVQTEIAQFNHSLALFAKRQEVEFNWLHQQRGKVIMELYAMLGDMLMELDLLIKKSHVKAGTIEQQYELRNYDLNAYHEKWDDTRIYYLHNKLCFSDELNKQILKLIGSYNAASDYYIAAIESPREAHRAFETAFQQIGLLLTSIEMEFQKHLGVEEKQKG